MRLLCVFMMSVCAVGCRVAESVGGAIMIDSNLAVYRSHERNNNYAAVRIARIQSAGMMPRGVVLAVDAPSMAYADIIMAASCYRNSCSAYLPSGQLSELRDAITMAMEPEDQADCMAFIVYNDKQPELVPFSSRTVMLKLYGKDSYWTYMNVFFLLECLE